MKFGLKFFDIIIICVILSLVVIGNLYSRSQANKHPVYYCVEGHKFVQSIEVETILPVFGEDDKPVKCKKELKLHD